MRIYRMRRRRAAPVVLALCAAACSVPVDFSGTKRPAPTPKVTTWESDTEAGAEAFEAGRYGEAEDRLELARERAAAGTGDDLAVAASLSNLAVVRRARGDLAGAIEAQQEALAIRERVLGPDHPEVATTLNTLAGLYAARDDYAAAEPLLTRALSIRERVLGPEDRYTAQSLNNLALLYAAEQRYADAEPLYQRAIAVFEQLNETAELVTTLENYAAMLADMGRTKEAEDVERRVRGLQVGDVLKQPAGR
jgi:tetratricopeptide (TPR) repeat protein